MMDLLEINNLKSLMHGGDEWEIAYVMQQSDLQQGIAAGRA